MSEYVFGSNNLEFDIYTMIKSKQLIISRIISKINNYNLIKPYLSKFSCLDKAFYFITAKYFIFNN